MFKWSAFDLFLFDFDGLLVNTELLHQKAYAEMLERRGYRLDWDFQTYAIYAHDSMEVLSKAIYTALPELKEEEPEWLVLREEKQAIYKGLIEGDDLELMPGVAEFLDATQGKARGVVTNSTKEHTLLIREKLPELNKISTWITRDDYKRPKPAPDGYLMGLELLGGKKAIGFEDSTKGIAALKQTPIEPVLILPPNYPRVENPPTTFSSFHELLHFQ